MEVDTQKPTSTPEPHADSAEHAVAKPPAAVSAPGTLTPDPSNFAIKHPLQHRWTMWYDNPGKRTSTTSWGDYLRKVVTIDTVEDFWGLYNNVLAASKLPAGANYHFFKDGIEPKWEDPENEKGGKWLVTLPPKARGEQLDKLWLWALLACIGEQYEDADEVCGVVVSVRRQANKIALWTKTAGSEAAQKRIGRTLKQALELPDSMVVGYQSHGDAMKKNSSYSAKNRYEV